jgi:hypothetical protein
MIDAGVDELDELLTRTIPNKMKRKHILELLITLITVFFISACDSIDNGEKTLPLTSAKIDGTSNTEILERPSALEITRNYNDILPVVDGWIAVGRFHDEHLDAIIVKYDKRGKRIWEKVFGVSDNLDEFHSVMEISDGYIVISRLSPPDIGPNINAIIKFDKEGHIIWAKDLSINALTVNEIGFVGVGGKKTTDVDTLFIAQFDTDGNIIWKKPIGDNINLDGKIFPAMDEVLHISKIFYGSDGYFLYGKSTYIYRSFGDMFSAEPGFIAFLNKDGDFYWQRPMDINKVYDITLIEDGIIVAGNIYDDSRYPFPLIKKYDLEMNLTWEIPYEKNSDSCYFKIAKVGNDIFVSAFRAIKGGSFVSGISAEGEKFWDSDAHINKKYTDYNNIFTIDGGLVVNVCSSGENSFLFYDSNFIANLKNGK